MDYRDLARKLPRKSTPAPKTFPNNYTNLTMNREYMMPSTSPIYLGPQTYNSSDCSWSSQDPDERMAGLRIFASVMLNSWRRRREDVKRLIEKVEELKRMSMKSKNQIHVYNTLFRVEQKRNDELTAQLRHSLDIINHAKSSCESLTTTVISLKADNALLEQELDFKYKEIDALNDVLTQTKDDLFHSMLETRTLQACLFKEKRNIQYLDTQKNKLVNELCELGSENRKCEDKYNKELQSKDSELKHALLLVESLRNTLNQIKQNESLLEEYGANNSRIKKEMRELQLHNKSLQEALDNSIGNRLLGWWHQWLFHQQKTIQMAHTFAFYLLPAMPPPKFTFISDIDC